MAWNLDIKGVVLPFSALKSGFEQPHTLNYPIDKRHDTPGYRGFHVNSAELCVGCGNCQEICMNEAIDMVEAEGEINPKNASGCLPRIDYGRCCWCGLCADVCGPGSLLLSGECVHVTDDVSSFLYMPKNQ